MSDSHKWQGMALSFMQAIFDAEITTEQKQAIFDMALSRSPAAQRGGDVTFESMIVSDALRDHERDCGE